MEQIEMANISVFTNHLIPRSDDLAISMVPELTGSDAETLMRLANANIGDLDEERIFHYEDMVFRATLVTDSFFEEGQCIAVVCDDPRIQENG